MWFEYSWMADAMMLEPYNPVMEKMYVDRMFWIDQQATTKEDFVARAILVRVLEITRRIGC